jgi:hypothetical protein
MNGNGSGVLNLRNAKKELGMGMPPDQLGCSSDDEALVRELCSPAAKLTIVESADWTIDLPISDTDIATTFGNTVDVWSTSNGKPPGGVAFASNTLATPGLIPSDMVIRGIRIRLLVEPETRVIKGNLVTVGDATPAPIPASFDVFDQNDVTNSLGNGTGQTQIPGWIYYGLPTWRAFYAFMNAYELVWSKTHQDLLIKEPLTQIATIQPFAEAEAAGLAFTGDWDTIATYNKRLQALVGAPGYPALQQFLPISHERLGSYTAGGQNISDVTPTREQDASPSIFGGIGVPQAPMDRHPFLFATPIYWPAGHTMAIQFSVKDPKYQASFHRWMSLTGGVNGQPGSDLALPFGAPGVFAASGLMPSAVAANVATELTEDSPPAAVTQQVPGIRSVNKLGRMRIEVGIVGLRVPQSWKRTVGRAVAAGAIQAPSGYGTLIMPNGSN